MNVPTPKQKPCIQDFLFTHRIIGVEHAACAIRTCRGPGDFVLRGNLLEAQGMELQERKRFA